MRDTVESVLGGKVLELKGSRIFVAARARRRRRGEPLFGHGGDKSVSL